MSITLLKANVRANRFIWILLTAIFSFYGVMLISMFDPDNVEALASMMEMMPPELVSAMGFSFGTSILTHLSGTLYTMLLYLFPLILTVVVNHRLIASHVDKGSMAYLLSTSNSRVKVGITQAVFSLLSAAAMFVVITVISLIMSTAMFPGNMEVGLFIQLNIYAFVLYFAISSVCFFGSCVANEAKHSLGIGAGIPIAFVILDMLGNLGEETSWLGNFSIFALFDPVKLIAGDAFAYISMAVLAAIAIALYSIGIWLFNKRDLPI